MCWRGLCVLQNLLILAQKMQVKFLQHNGLGSTKSLQKCTSMPSITDTAASSTGSIEAQEDEYRRLISKWILSYTKRVSKTTQYLAVTYLNALLRKAILITEQNYELVAVGLLLLASKMNEIYPPKVSSLLARCSRQYSKDQVYAAEEKILAAFDFDIALDSTPYSHIHRILGHIYADKLEECEKLLRIVGGYREVYQRGDEMLAYAIIYLIIPQFVKDMRLPQNKEIKTLAVRIYNLYLQNKEKYQREKENRGK